LKVLRYEPKEFALEILFSQYSAVKENDIYVYKYTRNKHVSDMQKRLNVWELCVTH